MHNPFENADTTAIIAIFGWAIAAIVIAFVVDKIGGIVFPKD